MNYREMNVGNIRKITNEEMFKLAGVSPEFDKRYTPVNIGKKGKIRTGERTMMSDIRNINFIDAAELKTLSPEMVKEYPTFYNESNNKLMAEPIKDYKAIVGENTKNIYSVVSQRYKPLQHAELIKATANMSENTGINLFGKLRDDNGIMNVHAIFTNPDYHINILEEQEDPMMLGMRLYNSHNRKTSFGAEFIGIRMICSNYMAHGETLGNITYKHFTEPDKITEQFEKMINGFMKNVPTLQNRMSNLQNEIITIDEATAMLFGISILPATIDAITKNLKGLNPEINNTQKITVYDLYNAGTAYVSHKAAGDNTLNTNLDNSNKLQRIVTEKTSKIIDLGIERKEKYDRKLLEMNRTEMPISIIGD